MTSNYRRCAVMGVSLQPFFCGIFMIAFLSFCPFAAHAQSEPDGTGPDWESFIEEWEEAQMREALQQALAQQELEILQILDPRRVVTLHDGVELPELSRAPLVSDGFYQPIPGAGPSATYELANQPRYTVSLGGVPLTYAGARVRLREALDSSGECVAPRSGSTVSLDVYSGWVTDVEQHSDDSVHYRQAWVKGYLTQHVMLAATGQPRTCRCVGATCEGDLSFCGSSSYVYRFVLHPAGGGRPIEFYRRPEETLTVSTRTFDVNGCPLSENAPAPPRRYWSVDGQLWLDVSDQAKPVVHYPDGAMEEFPPAFFIDQPQGAGRCQAVPAASYGCRTNCRPSGPLFYTDRNGNRTAWTVSANGLVETVTDPRGRVTTLTFEAASPFPRLRFVDVPATGSGTLRYTVSWTNLTVNLSTAFPDIQCHLFGTCGTRTVPLVSSIQVPDGRSYTFQYGPWGNLTRVAEPNGAVRTYAYGGSTNTAYAVNSVPLNSRAPKVADGTPGGCAIWTGQAVALQKRGLLEERLFPDGDGVPPPGNVRPVHLTRTDYEYVRLPGCAVDLLGAATSPAACCAQVWRKITQPDGAIRRVGTCANALAPLAPFETGPVTRHGWEIGEEIWDPGTGTAATSCTTAAGCRSATYTADKATGQSFFAFDNLPHLTGPVPPAADRRPTRTVSVRDGVVTTSTFAYQDLIDIDRGSETVLRNTGNITRQCLWSGGAATSCDSGGGGVKQVETVASFFHPSPYHDPDPAVTRHLLRLPASVSLVDPVRGVLTRTDTAYDQFPVTASGAVNRVEVGGARGNPTTVTSYGEPQTAGAPVSITTRYYDTGDLREVRDGRGNPVTTTPDFRLCSQTPRLTAVVTNALGHPVTTVTDCATGVALAVRDANGQVTCSKYDLLGRLLESAGPGDRLTAGGVTSPTDCPAGATGPTERYEYFRLGVSGEAATIEQQRTVARGKDGSADGLYRKTFLDGLGRTVQVRAEVDPATAGGFAERVVTTEFDSAGRVARSHVPCYAAASDSRVPCPGALFTATTYDALGRVTRIVPPGLPAITTRYEGAGSSWVTTVTNPRGFESRTVTDLLGRTVESARRWQECPGGPCWVGSTFEYDAAGRQLAAAQLANPVATRMTMTYDGLGRRLTLMDPDMGGFAGLSWRYTYDENGNLRTQIDPKGQVITLAYDALDRIVLRDLPPAGPGVEDVTYHYDGLLPATCHSCDDRCATTTDNCTIATLTCVHTGTPCDGGGGPPPPPPPCTFSISPTSATFGAPGGSGNIALTTQTGCSWTASSPVSWASITSAPSGSGSATVSYSVQANPDPAPRSSSLTVGGQLFTLSQSASAPACSFTLSPTSASFGSSGGAGNVALTTQTGCNWTAVSNAAFLSVTGGASGTGSGTITYEVAANSGAARSGTLSIADQLFSVSQAGSAVCTFSITPSTVSIGGGGGSGSVTVTAGAGCGWTAVSNVPWIVVTAGGSGSGNGTVGYQVMANPGAARTGTLTIAGRTFKVNQAGGSTCTFSISPGSTSVPAAGASGTVSVTTAGGCAWTAVSNVGWVTVTAGSTGSGNGTVGYQVAANSGSARSGALTIAGKTFTVSQSGVGTGAPAAPAALQGSQTPGVPEVDLTWADGSDNETVFRIERRGGNTAFAEIGQTGADQTSFHDANGSGETGTLIYRVRACNASGCSAYSNEAPVTVF